MIEKPGRSEQAQPSGRIRSAKPLIDLLNPRIVPVDAVRTKARLAELKDAAKAAGAVVRDVADLYEPPAEAEGVSLVVETPEPATIRAMLGNAGRRD